MAPQTTAARILLLTTLLLALAGDFLLRGEPWGLNFTVFSLLLFAAIAFLSRRLDNPTPTEAWLIAALGLLAAAGFSWRDSPGLIAFNFLATAGAALLVTAKTRPGELVRMTFLNHFSHALVQMLHIAVGSVFLLLRDLRPGGGEQAGQRARWGRIWLGIALAIPPLLLFGSLLASADATFEYLITEVLWIDVWTLIGHAALIAFLTWTIGGWLRGRFLGSEFAASPIHLSRRVSLGATETAIVIGSLDLLFGAFVLLQISYFFGGHAAVLGTPALTYAEYARRGFFELIAVAALSLSLLLASDWLLQTEDPRKRRLIRTLSVVMIALLGVMLASAVHRLLLYMEAYGLTVARVHAAAGLTWVTLTLLLFCVTVLRGKRNLLPFAMIVSGYVVLSGLNAVNPDALVARVNMARLTTDGQFDPGYTFALSADAVPVLLEAIPSLGPEHRSELSERLLKRYACPDPDKDIRTWNAARATATSLVCGREGELRRYLLPHHASGTPVP